MAVNGEIVENGEYPEKMIKLGDWNINYLKVGSGPHVLFFMPGTLGTIWSNFKPQIEQFDKELFTLVVWDPPGFGKSRPPETDFSIDMYEKYADYAFEFLQAIGIKKFTIMGWCGGGRSAIILAAKHPEAINKMVIWGANSYIIPSDLKMIDQFRDIKRWSRQMRDPLIEIYGEELLARYWSLWMDGLFNLVKTKNGNICSDFLKDISCPTFILHGMRDPMVKEEHVNFIHENIKGSRIYIYTDGSHDIHLKKTEDFNQRVLEFLLEP